MMDRRNKANMDDIARVAGVSKMTVSRVLRGGNGFSEETRGKVLAAAETLGYVPNRLAAAFGSDQASTLVGMCVPRLSSSLFGQVLDGVDRALTRLGYQLMIGASNHAVEQEEDWVRQVVSWRPAGVILSGRLHTPATVELLRQSAMPVVEVWELTTSPVDMAVGFSHFDCGMEMGQFLLRRGRRKVGYVGALGLSDVISSARLDGFEAALSAGGIRLQRRKSSSTIRASIGVFTGLRHCSPASRTLMRFIFTTTKWPSVASPIARRVASVCRRIWASRVGAAWKQPPFCRAA